MNKDPNYVVRVEKAIAEKYGKETVQNPRTNWTPEKEEEYKQQLKDFLERTRKDSAASEKVEINGVLISKKLLSRDANRSCPVCSEYSFSSQDDVYMNKFKCCFKCYIEYIEGREDRWANGWRPEKEKHNGNNL
tara:strand:+ start:552 stop:953 length:402 start_codon:yes stop_codon:yes gene_type:complete